ncbi:MAG: Uma2 family endonuclease [Chitinophagales bacterium]
MPDKNYIPKYTYSDYEKWQGNWELIYGAPVAMSPSPKRKHQVIEKKLIQSFLVDNKDKQENCDCEIYHGLDWKIDAQTVLRPDLMIVCGVFNTDFLEFPPLLVVEIASDSTRLLDRNTKFGIYEQNGVKFYIIADPSNQTIETFQLINNVYSSIDTNVFELNQKCTITLNFKDLFSN